MTARPTSEGTKLSTAASEPVLGCIADDLTGATDLANVLVCEGMRVALVVGVPPPADPVDDVDAVVVALKSRTAPAEVAVAESLASLDWLRGRGVEQVLFKYCSTFDSTDRGNIGPVADALAEALEVPTTIACPAFPEAGRTVYAGHLFVDGRLLSESPMTDHPLTPMRDPDLVRVLGRQTPHRVAGIGHDTVRNGPEAIRTTLLAHERDGVRHLVVDALTDGHLRVIGRACAGLPLVTGGSGIARGLVANFPTVDATTAAPVDPREIVGPAALLSGSCSAATREQVRRQRERGPVVDLDPVDLVDDPGSLAERTRQAVAALGPDPVLVTASAPPEAVTAAQQRLGRARAGDVVEHALAETARALVSAGARRLVVAGGETAAAVVTALGVRVLRIGPEIAPGVPWTLAEGEGPALALALKSGNFGRPDFFADALEWWA